MSNSDKSWFDITLEEEDESQAAPERSTANHFTTLDSRKCLSVLSPLREADRALEIREELSVNEHIDGRGAHAISTTPKKTKLGPRAAQRHSIEEKLDGAPIESAAFSPVRSSKRYLKSNEIDGMAMESDDYSTARGSRRKPMKLMEPSCITSGLDGLPMESVDYSPARKVKIGFVEASTSRKTNIETIDSSPLSRNVKSRLGPRASSRHSTPDQIGNKRHLVRDSPLRDTDHKDKRYRTGTPTGEKHTPTRNKTPTRNTRQAQDSFKRNEGHTFSTPEPIKKPRTQSEKFKTPNSDSRVYTKKTGNGAAAAGEGKDLFGHGRRRGISESSKENEPVKPLTEEQIAKREKQVLYGKVTEGYQNYKIVIPKNLRKIRDPATPKKDYPYSKRCWDGLIRSWRRKLHEWDDPKVGLELRAAYTHNNRDLKADGLITASGEVVCCGSIGMTSSEGSYVPSSQEPTSSEEQNRGETEAPLSTEWKIPDFIYSGDDDDARSVDSEYTRLVGNREDFPDDDVSDRSYHLSQDSGDLEEEMMSCDDDEITDMTDQTREIAV